MHIESCTRTCIAIVLVVTLITLTVATSMAFIGAIRDDSIGAFMWTYGIATAIAITIATTVCVGILLIVQVLVQWRRHVRRDLEQQIRLLALREYPCDNCGCGSLKLQCPRHPFYNGTAMVNRDMIAHGTLVTGFSRPADLQLHTRSAIVCDTCSGGHIVDCMCTRGASPGRWCTTCTGSGVVKR